MLNSEGFAFTLYMSRVPIPPRVVVLSVLAILLTTVLGLVLNLVSGYPRLLTWLSDRPWYTLRNLLIASTILLIATAIVAVWQQFSERRDRNADLEHVEEIRSGTDGHEVESAKPTSQDADEGAEIYRGMKLKKILTPNQVLMDKELGRAFVEGRCAGPSKNYRRKSGSVEV